MKAALLKNQDGFSLIELMMVVGIVGLLSAIAVPSMKLMSDRAKISAAKSQMALAVSTAEIIHLSNKTVIEAIIEVYPASAGCTHCLQGASGHSDPATWTNISAGDASWRVLGYPSTPIDPWGRPWVMDENQGEYGPDDCRFDSLFSAGPDGIWEGVGGGDQALGDDVIVRLPRYKGGAWNCTNGTVETGSNP